MIKALLTPKILIILGVAAFLAFTVYTFQKNQYLKNENEKQQNQIAVLRSDSLALSSSVSNLKADIFRLKSDSSKFETRITNMKLTWYENNEQLKIKVDSTIKANRNNGGASGRNAVINLLQDFSTKGRL